MNKGDKVKFAVPENEAEAALVMTVIEDRDPRVLVETPIRNFSARFYPQSAFLKTDLRPVAEGEV